MKKIVLLGALSLSVFFAKAQTSSFTYQGIATNNNNVPYNNRTLGFRISILQTTNTGTAEYVERHAGITTSANGVFGLNVGNGTALTGTFAGIKWTATTKYLKIEVDTLNGTNYVAIGTPSLLQSVPFALQATNAVNATNATNATTATNSLKIQNVSVSATAPKTGDVLTFNGTSWVATPSVSALYRADPPAGVLKNNTDVPFILTKKITDTHNAYNTTTGVYTVPLSGIYSIHSITQIHGTALSGTPYASFVIWVDGVQVAQTLDDNVSSLLAYGLKPSIYVQGLMLNAGQKVVVTVDMNQVDSPKFGGNVISFFSIVRTGN